MHHFNRKHPLAAAVALGFTALSSLHAQSATVYATGLLSPSKVILGPAGTLLVSEAGETPNSGRISLIAANGARQTLIDGLPSGLSGRDADGPTGIVLDGNTLFVAIGEGDQLVPGPTQGTQVPNPKGPSSPILTSILQINFGQSVELVTTGFILKPADHTTLVDGDSVVLDNGTGKATISLLALFNYRPDATSIYKNSHPYGLIKLPTDANNLYMTNAGLNSLVQVNIQTGRARTVARFAPQRNGGPTGPPVSEAVPDSLRVYGDQLLVTLLTGFPFFTGNSKILAVNPATGASSVFLDNLTSAIDIVWRARPLARPVFYVLEHSANILTGAPGRLRVYDSSDPRTAVDGLNGPTSLALDAQSGKLYITSRTDGTVLVYDTGR